MTECSTTLEYSLKLEYWVNHQADHVKIASVYVCKYGLEPHAYQLNFANGSSREHCSDPLCRIEHQRESDARNRERSRIRMRLIRAMGGA